LRFGLRFLLGFLVAGLVRGCDDGVVLQLAGGLGLGMGAGSPFPGYLYHCRCLNPTQSQPQVRSYIYPAAVVRIGPVGLSLLLILTQVTVSGLYRTSKVASTNFGPAHAARLCARSVSACAGGGWDGFSGRGGGGCGCGWR
jgi:hypothetical protein